MPKKSLGKRWRRNSQCCWYTMAPVSLLDASHQHSGQGPQGQLHSGSGSSGGICGQLKGPPFIRPRCPVWSQPLLPGCDPGLPNVFCELSSLPQEREKSLSHLCLYASLHQAKLVPHLLREAWPDYPNTLPSFRNPALASPGDWNLMVKYLESFTVSCVSFHLISSPRYSSLLERRSHFFFCILYCALYSAKHSISGDQIFIDWLTSYIVPFPQLEYKL